MRRMYCCQLMWFVGCLLERCKEGKAYLYPQVCLIPLLSLTCDSDRDCVVQTLTVLSSLILGSRRPVRDDSTIHTGFTQARERR